MVTVLVLLSYQIKKLPPPRPEDSGSTNPKTDCAAIIASAAVPPSSRILAPAAEAKELAVTIIQSFPKTGTTSFLACMEAFICSVFKSS